MNELVLSYSGASKYDECPFAWKCRYVDKLQERPRHFFSLGKSVHASIESFHSGSIPPVEDMLLVLRDSWKSEGYRDEDHERECWDDAVAMVRGYHAKLVKARGEALFVELEFKVAIGRGLWVRGFMDLVERFDNRSVKVLDFKTGKPFKSGRLESDKQLTTYQMACETLDLAVGRLSLYHLPSLSEFHVPPRNPLEVEGVKAWFHGTAERIRAGKFEPDPNDRKCRWCDYRAACPIFKRAS
jgi:putative RecB family exonuclease